MFFITPKDNGFIYTISRLPVKAEYSDYISAADYKKAGIKYIEPMTANELTTEEEQDEALNSPDFLCEEKLDGVRATLHIFKNGSRVFSRRESKKTGWLCENSDSLPQLKMIHSEALDGTILDGELKIPDFPFNATSAVMNSLWETAVHRQFYEFGFAVFNVFDIIYYKGKSVCDESLNVRKIYLSQVVHDLKSEWIKEVPVIHTFVNIRFTGKELRELEDKKEKYPTLYDEFKSLVKSNLEDASYYSHAATKKAYYEYIVMNGGEGVMMKPKNGKYEFKRGNNYLKIKKFLTRDVIILGFAEPTKEYKGKYPTFEQWRYWENIDGDIFDTSIPSELNRVKDEQTREGVAPVSKYYAESWVGNIVFGVIITQEEKARLSEKKKFKFTRYNGNEIIVVGDCSGFTEETREYFTANKESMIGRVVEIKANEIFKDTGKLRHPRYLRMRDDKDYTMCTWKDHIL